MKYCIKYNLNTGLKIVGLFLLLGCFTSCGSFKTLNIDVLKPASMNLGEDDVQLIFVDRKIIHESDSISAKSLYNSLRLKREDVVNCFYDGLRDGLRNGVRPVLLIKGLGLMSSYVPDGYVPEPISPEGIAMLKKNGKMTHVIAVEYCVFNLDRSAQIILDNNLLIRLYDGATGQVLDSLNSQQLGLVYHSSAEGNDATVICNFFYDKGVKYAERLTPTWTPAERRIYLGNPLLKIGYGAFMDENLPEARRLWNAALGMKPKIAIQAAVNLAWLYEQEGNFLAAISLLEVAQKTAQQYGVEGNLVAYIADYIKILLQRNVDESKILEQL